MKARQVSWLLISSVAAQVKIGSFDSADWNSALRTADDLIATLNISQKALLVTGNLRSPCVGNIEPIAGSDFRGLCLMDGPFGVRQAAGVSLFPAGLAQAATWDVDLIHEAGRALGSEFYAKGAHVLLGPTVGPMGRQPLGGRNWEALSPDPYLAGQLVRQMIRGIQEQGVQACVKHLVANEQETQRTNSVSPNGTAVEGISSNVDDRTMHELYLWPFADAIKAGVASIMCSYNRLNGTYACENDILLNGIVKKELGFPGYIMSDWFATHSGVPSIVSGLDMNQPGAIDVTEASSPSPRSYFGGNVTLAISNGSLSEDRLDDMVRRILAPFYLLGQNNNYPSVDPTTRIVFASMINQFENAKNLLGIDPETLPAPRDVRGDHAKLIRKIGAEGIVLLKNTGKILPLKQPPNLGVFGNDAADVSEGFSYRADNVYQSPFSFDIGTLAHGGGAGAGRPNYITSPIAALRQRVEEYGGDIQYVFNNQMIARGDLHTIYPTPDVCLVFLKTFAREAVDRTTFENDWNSTLVVETVAKRCNNTVVITHSAGVNTYPWADHPNVKAILAAHFPGQESGNSIVDVLFGDVNPSGRLPYTIPKNESDVDFPIVNITGAGAYDSAAWQANFTEGQLIDYRHYDARNITPLYEFGFGLSYTDFSLISPLEGILTHGVLQAFPAQGYGIYMGGNPQLWDTVVVLHTTVQNTAEIAGAQVVQLYASMPEGSTPSGTPVRMLRGFKKTFLAAGQSARVEFEIRRRDISFWNVTAQDWQIPEGMFRFDAGFSSRNLLRSLELRFL